MSWRREIVREIEGCYGVERLCGELMVVMEKRDYVRLGEWWWVAMEIGWEAGVEGCNLWLVSLNSSPNKSLEPG